MSLEEVCLIWLLDYRNLKGRYAKPAKSCKKKNSYIPLQIYHLVCAPGARVPYITTNFFYTFGTQIYIQEK